MLIIEKPFLPARPVILGVVSSTLYSAFDFFASASSKAFKSFSVKPKSDLDTFAFDLKKPD